MGCCGSGLGDRRSFDDLAPVAFDATSDGSSPELCKRLPFSVLEKIVAISEPDQLLLQFDEELLRVSVAKSVDRLLDFDALRILE